MCRREYDIINKYARKSSGRVISVLCRAHVQVVVALVHYIVVGRTFLIGFSGVPSRGTEWRQGGWCRGVVVRKRRKAYAQVASRETRRGAGARHARFHAARRSALAERRQIGTTAVRQTTAATADHPETAMRVQRVDCWRVVAAGHRRRVVVLLLLNIIITIVTIIIITMRY